MGRGGPKLTHLLFADDCILFCRANTEECQNIMSLLGTYEGASGQKNQCKKDLFVLQLQYATRDTNVAPNGLGAPAIKQVEKYLGLPPMIGRDKSKAFSAIKKRVGTKLHG